MSMQATKLYIRKDGDKFYCTTQKVEVNSKLRRYDTYDKLLAKSGRVPNSSMAYKIVDETKKESNA
jgi:ASC-1-like (ASCH) protein